MSEIFNWVNLIILAISVIFGTIYQNILVEAYPERSSWLNIKIGILISTFVSLLTIVCVTIAKSLI
jgi:uncharacterized membrane protein YagU involved in acid resistance